MQVAAEHDEGFALIGGLARIGNAIRIFARIAKAQRVLRLHTGGDFHALGVFIQQRKQTRARADAQVMIAARADEKVFFQFGAVEHRLAALAFEPQPFGDGFF